MTEADAPTRLARREFCNCLALGSAALLVAPALARNAPEQRTLHYPAQRIAGAESLLPGAVLAFNYPTEHDPALLVRTQSGEFYAYGQRCTHLGCSVNFERRSNRFECPCHRGAFDLQTGHVLFGPPRRPLEQIELEMRAGGEVWAVGRRIS
jgi:nitrite reductase/ring-hydroxylating ferredoxin subunit